ncbi:TROPOMYOSIN [Salix purpurea]|uniref:TROPOMYOSIN n=1 Tax=Salix purpurea TaxID=77065 RepID=A0A9Q0ZS66_SALPP|nr:TROPOMYOSIN [Salix purpurea]
MKESDEDEEEDDVDTSDGSEEEDEEEEEEDGENKGNEKRPAGKDRARTVSLRGYQSKILISSHQEKVKTDNPIKTSELNMVQGFISISWWRACFANCSSEMERSVKQMLKLIEEDGASLAMKAEMCRQTRPDLISKIKEFNSMQQSLAECYEYVTAELSNSIPSEFHEQGADSSESGHESPLLTPDQKLGFHKAGNRAPSISSHGASSDLSLKEGSESFSSLSSDSESESFNSSGNAYYSLPVNTDRSGLHKKIIHMGTELSSMEEKLRMHEEENRDSMLNGEENRSYEELLSRVIGYEEELRVTKVKLQLSEDEVTRLKIELQKSGFFQGSFRDFASSA